MGISIFKDCDIRQALYCSVLKQHENDIDTLVLDELGIMQGTCRVDIAVINGIIHGYEIKSDADTLNRLPTQSDVYGRVLDRATLVVGESHLEASEKIIPNWWEIKVVTAKKDKNIKISPHRTGRQNKAVDAYSLVQLLWRDEVADLLLEMGFIPKDLRNPKDVLYRMLAENMPLKNLKDATRFILKNRTTWRCHKQPLLSVG